MSEDPVHYGPNGHLHEKRLRAAAVLRAGAEWLSRVPGDHLPEILARLEALVVELEAALPDHERRFIRPVRRVG